MDKVDYSFIKKWLCSGEIKQLAKDNNLKPDAAYKRLNGAVRDPAFVKKAFDLAYQRANECLAMRRQMQEIEEKIKDFENRDNSHPG